MSPYHDHSREQRLPITRSLLRICLLVILLLGTWLRLKALTADTRLQPDEALFSTFARRAALNGEWLLPGALDKPPLAIYASALGMTPFAESRANLLPDLRMRLGELAARLPAALASILSLPLMYAVCHRWYRDVRVSLLGALMLAISPLAVSFSAVAFTDGLLCFCLLACLWALSAGRWGMAGLWIGLAFLGKQQALLYVPLVMALGWCSGQITLKRVLSFFGFVISSIVLLTIWDGARAQPPGVLALAWANNNPARLIRSDEVLVRLSAWWAHVSRAFAPATVPVLLVGGVAVIWRAVREKPNRAGLCDMVILTYVLAYALLHWLVAFNTYDRYVLPALPLLLALGARGTIAFWDWWRVRLPSAELAFAGLVVASVVLGSAHSAANVPAVHGDDGRDYSGIDQVAALLNQLPVGAIVYDHWLGWELDYYLGQWTDKRRVYYPSPRALADDALRQPDPASRYFAAPAWEAASPWLEALRAAGFSPRQVFHVERFFVYELTPPG